MNNDISTKSVCFEQADLCILHKKQGVSSWLCGLREVYIFFIICVSCEIVYKNVKERSEKPSGCRQIFEEIQGREDLKTRYPTIFTK
jgi:hypothetical protein